MERTLESALAPSAIGYQTQKSLEVEEKQSNLKIADKKSDTEEDDYSEDEYSDQFESEDEGDDTTMASSIKGKTPEDKQVNRQALED